MTGLFLVPCTELGKVGRDRNTPGLLHILQSIEKMEGLPRNHKAAVVVLVVCGEAVVNEVSKAKYQHPYILANGVDIKVVIVPQDVVKLVRPGRHLLAVLSNVALAYAVEYYPKAQWVTLLKPEDQFSSAHLKNVFRFDI